MGKLIIFFFIINNSLISIGQTYIGPVIGYDFAKIQSNSEEIYSGIYNTYKKGFSIKSPVFGIKIEQYLIGGLFCSFESTFTHKNVPASGQGILPVYGFMFNYYQQYLSIRYLVAQTIYIGGGLNYNFLNRIRWDNGAQFNSFDFPNLTWNEKGIHFSVGLKLSDFDLEVYFYNSSSHLKSAILEGYHLDPVSSFGINLSYDLKIFEPFKLFNKKAASCPSF